MFVQGSKTMGFDQCKMGITRNLNGMTHGVKIKNPDVKSGFFC